MALSELVAAAPALAPLLAGLAAAGLVVAGFWPLLAPDRFKARTAAVASGRAPAARRADAPRKNEAKPSLKREPKRLFRSIVEGFNLSRHVADGRIVHRLRMAGFRGQAPVVTYLAFLVLTPAVMVAVAGFYVFGVFPAGQPLILKVGIVLAVTVASIYLPSIYIKNRILKRQHAIRKAWPDALDLLLICVESGMGIESALRKVAGELAEAAPALADELRMTTAELSYLQDRRMAYENLGERTGLDSVKAVVTSLVQSEKYGTSLGQALRVLAQENRDQRMAEAEKKAAALPPKLTVPMILFFLPVLFAVIIAPAVIQWVTQ